MRDCLSGSETAEARAGFASASAADRRIAGVAAAARAVRVLADRGARDVVLLIGDGAAPAAATVADIERLRGAANVRVIAGDGPAVPLPDSWQIVRATGKPGDGLVSRWLNRPVSQRISWLLLHIPAARPLHVTVANALLAALMLAVLVRSGHAGMIAGGLLFQLASVLDGVDGEMARASFRTSSRGAVLDTFVDMATNVLFVLGVTLNLALGGAPHAALLGGWGLALFVIGLALLVRRAGRARGPFTLDLLKAGQTSGNPVRGPLLAFGATVTSRDFFALLFALLILAGRPMAVLYIFAAAASIWLPVVIVSGVATRAPAAVSRPR